MTLTRPLRGRIPAAGSVTVDSSALIVTSGVTAVTGIAFWAIAARLIPPHELGIETAVLSLMTTAGTVAASGPGNALTAMLPATPLVARGGLLRHAAMVVTGTALLCGLVAGVLGAATIGDAPPVLQCLIVVAGSVVMAWFAFKDAVLTALSAARRLPGINLLAAGAKLALLPVLIAGATWYSAVFATILTAALAVVIVWFRMVPRAITLQSPETGRERTHTGRSLIGFSMRDGTASLISMGTLMGAPFLVTWLAGPVQGAMLALMLPVSQGLDFFSIGTATALTKHLATSDDPLRLITRVWRSVFGLVVALGAFLVIACAPLLVALFGKNYPHHTLWVILALLSAGSVGRVSFVMWAAALRALLATRRLLISNACVSAVTLPILVVATLEWGAVGTAGALAFGSVLLGVVGACGLVGVMRGYHPAVQAKGSVV
ncbi:lipopolysaccharide biosynthesis protein [Gordonia sp. NPDC003429]